jgi:hypothetical protein
MRGSSISFLTRARVAWLDSCFGLFLGILARFHESEGITGQFGTEAGSFRIIFIPCSFEQLCQSAKCSISGVNTNGALPPRVGGLDYRRRTVSEGRRRVEGNEVQIFTVSLNGANFICADSESNIMKRYSWGAYVLHAAACVSFSIAGNVAFPILAAAERVMGPSRTGGCPKSPCYNLLFSVA